jgi:2-isopropylmalate synthase
MTTHPPLRIYDTTLRDGNQGIGIGLSLRDKLLIAERLSELGFHYIEGGWPNPTNEIDRAFYPEVRKRRLQARIAAFGSTRRPGTTVEEDPFMQLLLATEAPVATIFGKSWDLHVDKVLRCSFAENVAMIGESVAYLKRHMDEVVYDAEHFFDGYRHNPEYALETLLAAQAGGADVLVLCDTNGGTLPSDFLRIYREVRAKTRAALGVHVHNDTGCAEANSILAAEEGAAQIQGTVNGIGERCGNANLITIVAALQLKRGMALIRDDQLARLADLSMFVSETANLAPNIRAPYVGSAAFSHKAGAHVDGVRKVRESFEHIAPGSVGNERHFVLSDQSGGGTILEKLKDIKPDLDRNDPTVKKLLARIKRMESEGYHFETADGTFKLAAMSMLGEFQEPFTVLGFRVIEEKNGDGAPTSEATIKVREGDVVEHTAAMGDGPVNALDAALRKALVKFFPRLAEVKLEDYKVRVLDGTAGTAAKVRVLIASTDGRERWGTIGVSANIIEASWLALIDSLMYKLMVDRQVPAHPVPDHHLLPAEEPA